MIKQQLKISLLLLSLSTFLNADFLLYLEQDKGTGSEAYCITNHYYENGFIYYLASNDTNYDLKRLSNYSKVDIKAGYIFDADNKCTLINKNTSTYETINDLEMNYINLSYLGLSSEHFNVLMALSGIIISFIFLYGLVRFI